MWIQISGTVEKRFFSQLHIMKMPLNGFSVILMKLNSKNQPNPQANLIIFMVDQGELEAVFRWVNGEDAWPAFPVQTVHTVSPHTGHIDGQIKSPDDAVITLEK